MKTGERIKQRRKQLNLSAEHIAEIVGVSPATIYRYENGGIEKVPGDLLEPIAKALFTTPQYLMGWEDSPDMPLADNILPIKKKQLPILGDIACGEPIYADEQFDGYVCAGDDVHADFCLHCKGDSMIGARIYDGDIVFIRKQSDVDDGEIAAVYIDGSATLKRVYKFPGKLILRAENPSYAPIEVTETNCDTVLILGKAVAVYGLIK